MPAPLTGYITAWENTYGYIYADMANMLQYFLGAADACDYKSWTGLAASFRLLSDTWGLAVAHFKLGSPNLYDTVHAAMHWIDVNWPTGGAVTMDAILVAMLGAKFSQLERFIGLEDAYRVALWNAPFNADFYAALARGFMKW